MRYASSKCKISHYAGDSPARWQGMWSWFKRARSKRASRGFPAMVRVRGADGQPVSRVTVEGVYEPSGRLVHDTRATPQGLCIFHWLANGSDERLRLRIRTDEGQTAEVEVPHDRPSPAEVIEVLLAEVG